MCKLKDLLEAEGQIVAAFFLAAHSRRTSVMQERGKVCREKAIQT